MSGAGALQRIYGLYRLDDDEKAKLNLGLSGCAITHADGHVTVSKTPKVPGKGQQYFINRFLNV